MGGDEKKRGIGEINIAGLPRPQIAVYVTHKIEEAIKSRPPQMFEGEERGGGVVQITGGPCNPRPHVAGYSVFTGVK